MRLPIVQFVIACLRKGVLHALVALQVLNPFLHAHAYGKAGETAGFMHLHVDVAPSGCGTTVASETTGETFFAQDGKRFDLDVPLTLVGASPRVPTPVRVRATEPAAPAMPRADPPWPALWPRAPPAADFA